MDVFGFALWFTPPPEIAQKVAEIINRLSKEYTAPVFEPHVTLLSEMTSPKDEIIDAMKKASEKFSPVILRLTDLGYAETYHHALFVRVDLTTQLLEMNHFFQDLLHMEKDTYMPHLSLLYGNYPSEAQEKLAAELNEMRDMQFVSDTIHLIQSSGDETTWKVVYSVPLRGIADK